MWGNIVVTLGSYWGNIVIILGNREVILGIWEEASGVWVSGVGAFTVRGLAVLKGLALLDFRVWVL